jgi:hypothetical protein
MLLKSMWSSKLYFGDNRLSDSQSLPEGTNLYPGFQNFLSDFGAVLYRISPGTCDEYCLVSLKSV